MTFSERFILLQCGITIGMFCSQRVSSSSLVDTIFLDASENVKYLGIILSSDGHYVHIIDQEKTYDHLTKYTPSNFSGQVKRSLAFRNLIISTHAPFYNERFHDKLPITHLKHPHPTHLEWIFSGPKTSCVTSTCQSARVRLCPTFRRILLELQVPLSIDQQTSSTKHNYYHRVHGDERNTNTFIRHLSMHPLNNIPQFIAPVVARMLQTTSCDSSTLSTRNLLSSQYKRSELESYLGDNAIRDISGSILGFHETCNQIAAEMSFLVNLDYFISNENLVAIAESIDGVHWSWSGLQSSDHLESIEVEVWLPDQPLSSTSSSLADYSKEAVSAFYKTPVISLQGYYFSYHHCSLSDSNSLAIHTRLLNSIVDNDGFGDSTGSTHSSGALQVLHCYKSQLVHLLLFRDALVKKQFLLNPHETHSKTFRIADDDDDNNDRHFMNNHRMKERMQTHPPLQVVDKTAKLTALRGYIETDILKIRGTFPGHVLLDFDVPTKIISILLSTGVECRYTLANCIDSCQSQYKEEQSHTMAVNIDAFQRVPHDLVPMIQQVLTFYRWARLSAEDKRRFVYEEKQRSDASRDAMIRTQRYILMNAVAAGEISPTDAIEKLSALFVT